MPPIKITSTIAKHPKNTIVLYPKHHKPKTIIQKFRHARNPKAVNSIRGVKIRFSKPDSPNEEIGKTMSKSIVNNFKSAIIATKK